MRLADDIVGVDHVVHPDQAIEIKTRDRMAQIVEITTEETDATTGIDTTETGMFVIEIGGSTTAIPKTIEDVMGFLRERKTRREIVGTANVNDVQKILIPLIHPALVVQKKIANKARVQVLRIRNHDKTLKYLEVRKARKKAKPWKLRTTMMRL